MLCLLRLKMESLDLALRKFTYMFVWYVIWLLVFHEMYINFHSFFFYFFFILHGIKYVHTKVNVMPYETHNGVLAPMPNKFTYLDLNY